MNRSSLWILPSVLLAATTALAQPAPAPADQPAPPAAPDQPTPPAAAPAEPAPAPAAPKKLGIFENGFFQPSLNLQFWTFVHDEPGAETAFSFRLRRAEIKLKGELIPKTVAYAVMIDPAKTLKVTKTNYVITDGAGNAQTVTVQNIGGDTSPLQDFYITWLTDYAEVSGGQFKIPVSWEGSNSATKLIMPERSQIGHTYGDQRDIGVRVEKKLGMFYYMVGVYNGQGRNQIDGNRQKDLAARVEVYPIDGLMVGGVAYSSVGQMTRAGTKQRFEGDVRLDKDNLLVQAEYIYARDKAADGAPFVNSHGAYGALGYTLLDHLQPVARVGFIDANADAAGGRVVEYSGGVNYYFKGNNLKLQASFSDFHPETGKDAQDGILAAQLTF